jgi:hypothetical protein
MNSAPTAPVTPAMATTGSFFTGVSPLIWAMLRAIKKAPVLFRRGFGSDDAIVKTYARTSPEARQGFAVFAVRLVVVIMARTYAAGLPRRQRVLGQKFASTRLNRTPLSRHKLTHEPSQSF